MKRIYFILAFILLLMPMFYSQSRAADDEVVYINPATGNPLTVSGVARAQCSDGIDNEDFATTGIDIPPLTGRGPPAIHRGSDTPRMIDCDDPVCYQYFNAFRTDCPSSGGSGSGGGTSTSERPRKCTGNVLEYADGGVGGITKIKDCAFGCVEEGGTAYCKDAPTITPPATGAGSSRGMGCTRESEGPSQNEDNQCDLIKGAEFSLEDNLQFQVNDGVPKLYSAKLVGLLPIENAATSGSCEYYYFPYTHEDYHGTKEFAFKRAEELPGMRACYFDSSSLESLRGLVGDGAEFPDEIVAYMETEERAASGRYIEDEKIINSGSCESTYELAGSFGDSNGNVIRHCVRHGDTFVTGQTYVTNSYLEKYDGVKSCRGGGIGNLWFKSGEDIVYFCVVKEVPSSENDVLRGSEFTESSCPQGMASEEEKFATYGSVSVQHCVDATKAGAGASRRNVEESTGTFGAAIICPEILRGDFEVTEEMCGSGGKVECAVDITSGRTEYFGFVLDKNECVISEDNGGAAITGNIEARADAVVANCDPSVPNEVLATCNDSALREGAECKCATDADCGVGEICGYIKGPGGFGKECVKENELDEGEYNLCDLLSDPSITRSLKGKEESICAGPIPSQCNDERTCMQQDCIDWRNKKSAELASQDKLKGAGKINIDGQEYQLCYFFGESRKSDRSKKCTDLNDLAKKAPQEYAYDSTFWGIVQDGKCVRPACNCACGGNPDLHGVCSDGVSVCFEKTGKDNVFKCEANEDAICGLDSSWSVNPAYSYSDNKDKGTRNLVPLVKDRCEQAGGIFWSEWWTSWGSLYINCHCDANPS